MDKIPQLTRNAIREILSLEIDPKKTHEVNVVLQIQTIKRSDNPKNPKVAIFSATMGDGGSKHNGFVISVAASENLNVGDIIKVLSVTLQILNGNGTKLVLVKKHEVMVRGAPLVGSMETNTENESNNVMMNSSKGHLEAQSPLETKEKFHQNKENYIQERRPYDGGNRQSTGKKNYMPLSSFTSFTRDPEILVRVTKKYELKQTNPSAFNNRGPSWVFSFNMIDKEGTEMQISVFGEIARTFSTIIREGGTYEIRGGYVRTNDRKFNSIKFNYKLTLDDNTKITEVEDDGSINQYTFNFNKIAEIANFGVFTIIDVYCYVLDAGEKTQKTLKKNGGTLQEDFRRLIIADDSEHKVECSLWRDHANLDIKNGDVLFMKFMRVGEFNGKNLGSSLDSMILINPNAKEALELKAFCESFPPENFKSLPQSGGAGNLSGGMGSAVTHATIKEVLESLDKPQLDEKYSPSYRVKAFVSYWDPLRESNFYVGCPNEKCKKKLSQETYGWSCLACQGISVTNPKYYYTLSLKVKDHSGEHWVDVFGALGEKITGMTAEKYEELRQNNDQVRLREMQRKIEFSMLILTCKAKIHSFQNVNKKRISVFKIENLGEGDTKIVEARRMIKGLKEILKI
jgi:replication factor A1